MLVRHIEKAGLVRHVQVPGVVKRIVRTREVVAVTMMHIIRPAGGLRRRSRGEPGGMVWYGFGNIIVAPRVERGRSLGPAVEQSLGIALERW